MREPAIEDLARSLLGTRCAQCLVTSLVAGQLRPVNESDLADAVAAAGLRARSALNRFRNRTIHTEKYKEVRERPLAWDRTDEFHVPLAVLTPG